MDRRDQGSLDAPRSPSRTRDHLANERTFLAWIRTALALIGLGFVLARLGLFLRLAAGRDTEAPGGGTHIGREFVSTGLAILALGTITAGWAGWLYRRAARMIDADRYEPARFTVLVLAVVVVAGGLVIVALVLWRAGHPLGLRGAIDQTSG
jgi:putative membrane protein